MEVCCGNVIRPDKRLPRGHSEEQIRVAQAKHRQRLVEHWQIPEGARVLELGCGQGDTTKVLARAVGREGRVLAIDTADPSYGGPVTIGEATRQVKASHVGGSIEFRLSFNVLDPAVRFTGDEFDFVVMAHSSWYFESLAQLGETLERIRPWARRLCFAEWDLLPKSPAQTAHLLAVLIQGQVEGFKSTSLANVRTPFPRSTAIRLLAETGWSVVTEDWIETTWLQDADWEIAACLAGAVREADAAGMPAKCVDFIRAETEALWEIAAPLHNRPLPCYSIVAERM